MFSSTRVEDCIQNNVCSSRRTSPHASSQYLQIRCQSGNLICLASQIPWKAGSDRFCIWCLNVPYAQCDWFQWVNLGELQLSMSDDEKTNPLETVGDLWSVLFWWQQYLLSQAEQQHITFKGLYSQMPVCILATPPLDSCLTFNTNYFLLYNHLAIYFPLCPHHLFYLFFIVIPYSV